MRWHVPLVAVVVALLAPPAPRGAATGQEATADLPTACSTAGDAAGNAPTLELAADPPQGSELVVLSAQRTDRLPRQDDGLVLTLRRLTLAPGVASEVRRAEGPLLYYVESGTVDVSVNGKSASYAAGSSVLVEARQLYGLRNHPSAPAAVLRLGLVPPQGDTSVGRIGDPAEVALAPAGLEPIASRQLLGGAVDPLPPGETLLFLACLTWDDPVADLGEQRYPGPVGLLVLDGRLRTGRADELGPGNCRLIQPDVPHRLQAGAPPPVVLLFGVVPSGQQLWATADAGGATSPPSGPVSFRCGDVEGAGDPAVDVDADRLFRLGAHLTA